MYTFSLALVSLLAGAVLADNPGIPSCAWDCVSGFGGCGQFDYQCICSNSAYIAKMACCVSKNCDPADQKATLQFANALCAGQHVTNLPQTATCASSSGASSSPTGSAAMTGSSSGSSSAPSSNASTTTSNTAASATSASAAASSSSPGAAPLNKANGLGLGAVIAGLAVAL